MRALRNLLAAAVFIAATVGTDVPAQAWMSCTQAEQQCAQLGGEYVHHYNADFCTAVFSCCDEYGCYGPQYRDLCFG